MTEIRNLLKSSMFCIDYCTSCFLNYANGQLKHETDLSPKKPYWLTQGYFKRYEGGSDSYHGLKEYVHQVWGLHMHPIL